jgi:hypothetical protein
MSFFKIVLFLVICFHSQYPRCSENIPGCFYFADKLDAEARRRRRSARVHSMTRTESSADNFASGWKTTYLWGSISWFSMTVAMAVRSIR